MWALHPLPQCRGRRKVSWLWSSKAEMYRGALTEDMHQATLNLFFPPLLPCVCPPYCISNLLSVGWGNKKYKHLKSCRLYKIHFGLSYWNEVRKQFVRPPSDLVANWLFQIRRPCTVHTGLGCWIAQLPQRLQFTNSGFIHFDLLLPSTVSISFEL